MQTRHSWATDCLLPAFKALTFIFLLTFTTTRPVLAQNEVVIWTGQTGPLWNTTDVNWDKAITTPPQPTATAFESGDIVVFDASGANKTITTSGVFTSAALYFWGNADYAFSGAGLTVTTATGTTLNPATDQSATGKLMIGQIAFGPNLNGTITTNAILDLTGTTLNSFANGIDIAGGGLRVNNADQLGTTFSKVRFVSSVPSSVSSAIASNSGIAAAVTASRSAGQKRQHR